MSASFYNTATQGSFNFIPLDTDTVTIKQVRAWASANGSPLYIYTIDQAMSADIANPAYTIWHSGPTMKQGDALFAFISGLGITVNIATIKNYDI